MSRPLLFCAHGADASSWPVAAGAWQRYTTDCWALVESLTWYLNLNFEVGFAERGRFMGSSHALCYGCWAIGPRSSRSSCPADQRRYQARRPSSRCRAGIIPLEGPCREPRPRLSSQGQVQHWELQFGTVCGARERAQPKCRAENFVFARLLLH